MLVLLLAGPLHHVTFHSHDDALANHEAAYQSDADHSPSDNGPEHHSSHSCPVCVLLSIGCTPPTCIAVVGEHQPALTILIWIESADFSLADQQLPGARAPPATAIS